MNGSSLLIVAAFFSFSASLLHIATIFGGASWYRFFGAGERMVKLAESGSKHPALITSCIAGVLFIWGLYALSGAGVIVTLPFLNIALMVITLIYLARGIIGLILPFVIAHPFLAQNSARFWLVSSAICLLFGLSYLLGIIASWNGY